MEKWIILNPPYEKYAVSNRGNVKNIKTNAILKQFIRHDGYMQVSLCGTKQKSFKVHRLVALMFNENIYAKPYVNHKDGDKLNNSNINLEWCTASENNYHAVEIGLVNATPIIIEDLRNGNIYTFPSISQGAVFINKDIRLVSRALRRLNGYLHGFKITKV